MLLHSCPDTVREFLLRKTQTSSPLSQGSFTARCPGQSITPAKADCRCRAPPAPRLRGNFMTIESKGVPAADIREIRLFSITRQGIFVKWAATSAAPKNKYWKFQLPSSDMFAAALFHQGLSCQKSYPHSLDARGPRSKIVDI